MSLCHGNFTLQRTWAAAPERIFSGWSDPALRAQWSGGPPGRWTGLRRSLDFRTGGSETIEGRINDSGVLTYYEARIHLVEPGQRLLWTYDLHLSASFHSITLASLVLEAAGGRTRATYTEQITFLSDHDGTADRQRDIEQELTALEGVLHLERA